MLNRNVAVRGKSSSSCWSASLTGGLSPAFAPMPACTNVNASNAIRNGRQTLRTVGGLLPDRLLQVGVDEGIELAVEDGLDIANARLGAVIGHQGVRVQHV